MVSNKKGNDMLRKDLQHIDRGRSSFTERFGMISNQSSDGKIGLELKLSGLWRIQFQSLFLFSFLEILPNLLCCNAHLCAISMGEEWMMWEEERDTWEIGFAPPLLPHRHAVTISSLELLTSSDNRCVLYTPEPF